MFLTVSFTFICSYHLFLANIWFIFGRCQVIIPCCWIFAWTLNIPLIMVTNFDKATGDCKWMWPEQWMGAANETTWLVGLAFIPLMVMTGLYSRVVHMLWFKRSNGNELANRQRVRAKEKYLNHELKAAGALIVGVWNRVGSILSRPRKLKKIQFPVGWGLANQGIWCAKQIEKHTLRGQRVEKLDCFLSWH